MRCPVLRQRMVLRGVGAGQGGGGSEWRAVNAKVREEVEFLCRDIATKIDALSMRAYADAARSAPLPAYAMSGTGVAYAATPGADRAYMGVLQQVRDLSNRRPRHETDARRSLPFYASATRCPVLTQRMPLPGGSGVEGVTAHGVVPPYGLSMPCPVLTYSMLLPGIGLYDCALPVWHLSCRGWYARLPAYALAVRCPVLT
eukprot:3417671-Rhodomonas_salina.1